MRPHPVLPAADGESDLFRNRLDNQIDMRHEFVRLAGLIDWTRFEETFGALYAERGRPGLPTRLMVGLHLIQHARALSDEQVCAQWLENAYFQYFTGETWFQTELPLDRTSMSVWRGRIGPEKLEALIAETLAAAKRAGAVEPHEMRRVYALHAPEVECIAKGKARTRYEFGVKASIAVTNARSAGGQFVLGIKAMPGLPYDGHTLKDQIAQVERLTGETVARVYVDKGYRGHGLKAPEIHITQSPGQRSPTVKRELRRRADEPPDARPLDARRSAPQAQESRPTPGAPPALAPEHGQE